MARWIRDLHDAYHARTGRWPSATPRRAGSASSPIDQTSFNGAGNRLRVNGAGNRRRVRGTG
ncbi:MAG: hypothetical protein ACRDQF_09975 [Thermocrispum sp.]